jgi:hypothetical protein
MRQVRAPESRKISEALATIAVPTPCSLLVLTRELANTRFAA